jgi:hypothetical protein
MERMARENREGDGTGAVAVASGVRKEMKVLLPDEVMKDIQIPEDGCYCKLCEAARYGTDKKREVEFLRASPRRVERRGVRRMLSEARHDRGL